jgi:cell division septation protein DedD
MISACGTPKASASSQRAPKSARPAIGAWPTLDELRETDERPRGSRVGALMLTSLGGACIVFAFIAQSHRRAPAATRSGDALGELLAQSKPAAAAELSGSDVTFPALLSDDPRTTTALAAIRPANQAAGNADPTRGPAANLASRWARPTPGGAPPPPTDRLPVMPLPARNLVSVSSLVDRPRDALAELAKQAGAATGAPAALGRPGGYQLQTSSFRTETEAAGFVLALRQRGHHAYSEAAQVPGRGTWYRVRIGPFGTKREAMSYRAEFEEREHLVPFVLDPPPSL